MDDGQTRQRVLDYLDAFYAGDVPGALDCVDDEIDMISYAPVELFPHLGHKHGKAWIPEAIQAQKKRYLSRKYEIRFIAVEGDRVATMQRLLMEKRGDRRIVQVDVAEFYTLRDGRIVEFCSFFDSFDLVQQLLGRDLTETLAASMLGAMRA
ncbi:nuclear transport factor 2 family protein [uncultured Bradyrhizobium sp.]|uniref:nuclear transport factor 2 family protein n=1 Tax=uncultured Bradyrhizobium sp. TaxID=199684 RepID=UPI0035CA8962